MAVPETSFDIRAQPETIASLPAEPPDDQQFKFTDFLFWRDVPTWYRLTFMSAGAVMCLSVMKQYLDRDKLEVFLPPRANRLPEGVRRAYTHREIASQALTQTGKRTAAAAVFAGTLFSGAYYLGQYRDAYDWRNFAASGAAAGLVMPVALRLPVRTCVLWSAFTACAGAAIGGITQMNPEFKDFFWDERHDFEGWFFGKFYDVKEARARARKEQATRLAATAQQQGVQPG